MRHFDLSRRSISWLARKYVNDVYPHISGIRGSAFLSRNLHKMALVSNLESTDKGFKKDIDGEEVFCSGYKDFEPLIFEGKVVEVIVDELNRAEIFADIGSYHGFYAMIAANKCSRVYAFEADSQNFRALSDNKELNGARQIFTERKAVWSDNTSIRLDEGRGTMTQVGEGSSKVEAVKLDDYFSGTEIPDLFKIDVEGAELEVLKGMTGIIKEERPRIILEVHSGNQIEKFSHSPSEVLDFLSSKGYSWEKIEEDKNTSIYRCKP